MPVQFNRSYELTFGDLIEQGFVGPIPPTGTKITELQIEFVLNQNSDSNPDTFICKITNLNEDTIGKLAKDKGIVLKVGYLNTGLENLFSGTIFHFVTTQQGADFVTTIQCGDGYTNVSQSDINRSFAKGFTVDKIIRELASNMSLAIGQFNNGNLGSTAGLNKVFPRGFIASGRTKDVLDSITEANGLEYTIQAGSLIVLAVGATKVEAEIQIEPATGMIGSPSLTTQNLKKKETKNDGGVRFQTLINPSLTVGRKVRINSKFFTNTPGRITKVIHRGSFRGKDWSSNAEMQIIEE